MLCGGGEIIWGALRGHWNSIEKIRKKNLIKKGGRNPHREFQHSSSIRKCLKIGGTDSTSGVVLVPPRGGGGSDFKNSKNSHTYRWSEPTLKISAP